MYRIVLLFSISINVVIAQSALQIAAEGSLPDGSSAAAIGQGIGDKVDGYAVAQVDKDASVSQVMITARGPSQPAPKPAPKPAPRITTKPVQQAIIQPSKKAYVQKYGVCEDIKGDKCYDIAKYSNCGYCVIEKYRLNGYGCSYISETLKKGNEIQTIVTPLCDCKSGFYVIDKKNCPTCDTILQELIACAGVKQTNSQVEIPVGCLAKVGVSEDVLKKCGFFYPAKSTKKYVDPVLSYPYPVVYSDPVKTLLLSQGPASATASANAVATGGQAVATANAVATTVSTKIKNL
eukprot:TRINITY_DN896_c0_g1_i3.p2 TRINITY_DN896_c0_g1~~TRINITY_DN896_c0_g1_i3.p2  ORF type:complete len:292 (+),score=36.15 TRINITY_DN896_c0_g1_i3:169-1044(+)